MWNKAAGIALLLPILTLQAGLLRAEEMPVVSEVQKENIKRLMAVTGAGNLSMQVMDMMMKSLRTNTPQVPGPFWDEFMRDIHEEELLDKVIPIYAKYYTDDEIKELIAFYETPLGRKIVSVTPMIMRESMISGQEWGQQLGKKAIDRLREKGYIKPAAETGTAPQKTEAAQ